MNVPFIGKKIEDISYLNSGICGKKGEDIFGKCLIS